MMDWIGLDDDGWNLLVWLPMTGALQPVEDSWPLLRVRALSRRATELRDC